MINLLSKVSAQNGLTGVMPGKMSIRSDSKYVYTPEQREANRQICDAGPDEAHRRIKQAAESKNRCDGLCYGGHCQGSLSAISMKLKIRRLTEVPVGNCFFLVQRLQQYASRLWIVWAGLLLFHTVLQLCPNSGTAGSSLRARPAVFRNPLSFKP